MVAKAVAGAQEEHGLALELFGADLVALRQGMGFGHGHQEGLVVQGGHGQAGIRKRFGQDGAIELTGAQHFQQLDGEILLQHQGHLRDAADGVAHQVRQQVRPDGVDHAQAQRAAQGVLAAFGDFLDGLRLFQHGLGLANDLFAQRRDADFGAATLEQLHVQLVFQLLDGHGQGGL